MEKETPSPMRKMRRNIFHKVGRRLEKLEKNLGISNPDLSDGSQSSFNDTSDNYYWQNAEIDEEEEDNVSIQSVPYPPSNSSRVEYYQTTDRPNQLSRSQSETVIINDTNSGASWRAKTEDFAPQRITKDSIWKNDQEIELICKELLEDKPSRLYECREYDKKVSLLRTTVSYNTPKVTVPVLYFLESTLSKPVFYKLIKQYPSAINNYLNIVKFSLDNDNYIAMLKQFGKIEDVGMIRIRQTSQLNDINSKISLLDQAAIETNKHPWWNLQVIEYKHLLRKQQELQRFTLASEFNIKLENRTVLDTYKILFNIYFRQQKYNSRQSDKNTVDYAKAIETAFHMSPQMIMCGKLSVIMQCGFRLHYEDFIHQAMHQGIFSKSYILPPEHIADMMYNWVKLSGEGQEKASEKTERFLTMIQNPERRIYYAEKFHNYDVAMDTIANILRDRIQFENLRKRIPRDHPSFNRATTLLENTKWKN